MIAFSFFSCIYRFCGRLSPHAHTHCTQHTCGLHILTCQGAGLPGEKAIGSGWVFKVKRNADRSIERYKAQRPGIDYNEVFAPTFCPATLRLILALAAMEDMDLRSVDISAAFTNGDLDVTIYMMQPEGFHLLEVIEHLWL